MENSFKKMLKGYQAFRQKYAKGKKSVMKFLSHYGQQPKVMVVACCDSRVDPAVILQCDPGDLFVVRNVANIVPPYEKDEAHHGTSAALEFGIRYLKVSHLILLGHSQCGGIQALLESKGSNHNDFINNWVSLIKMPDLSSHDTDDCAKHALHHSYHNCLTFPWIKEKVDQRVLIIHRWFFDIKIGQIFNYVESENSYQSLDYNSLTNATSRP